MPRARAILDQTAITAAFAPDGLHGVSAAEVAARAGIAKPTLYAHGRSKDAVFAACVEFEVERLVARLHTADVRTAGQPLHQRAAALALALLDHAARRPEAFRLLHVTASHRRSTVARDVDRALGRIPDRIATALARDVKERETSLFFHAARGLHGAAVGLAGVEDREAAAAMLGRAVAAGLRSPAPEPEVPAQIELGVY